MKTHTRVSIALLAVAVLIGSLTLFKNDEAPHVETASSTSASASPEKQRTSTTTSEKPQTPTASPPVAQAKAPQSPAVAGPSSAGTAPSQAAATSAPETRRLVFKTVGKTTGQPLAQGESVARQGKLARRQVQGRVTQIQRPSFAGLKPGDTLTIPVSDRESTQAIVHFVTTPVKGAVSVIGGLEGKRGSFSFESVDGKVQGQLLLLKEEIAFRLEDKGGSDVLWKEVPLGEVMCLPPKASLLTSQMGTKLTVQDSVSGLAPPPAASEPAPIFNSRPAATVQFYLNFNGEIVEGTSWNSQHNAGNAIVAAPAGLTAAQITTVLNEVAEYYRAFDVNVTTDPAKYSAAQLTKRMKCIVTPTNIAADGDANTLGIAYLNKFGTISPDAVCWAFTHDVPTYGIQAIAASAAHEIGHTLSLTHDGTNTAGYYTGHGQGSVQMSPPGFSLLYNDRWGPIMGSPFKLQSYGPPYNADIRVRADVVQWSKGEYAGANNPQDDVAIIAGKVGYVPDEAGNTRATTTQFPSGNVNQSGIISSETDDDFYIIFTSGGTISMTASPSPNLDIALELQDTAGSVIASSNPSGPVAASVSASVSAGVYFIKVSGSGDMDPATTGYSKYGSIGAYTLTGSIDGWENHPSYEYDLAFTNPSAAGNLVKIGNAEVYSTDLATVTTAEEAYVQFNYANSGWNSIASNGFTFGVTIDGVATPTIRNTAVVPGFGTNNNFSYSLGQLPAGSHQVVVTLDKDGEIPENNEANNVASRWFNVVGAVGTAPDMAPLPQTWLGRPHGHFHRDRDEHQRIPHRLNS